MPDQKQPAIRRLMDNTWLLLFLGVVVPFISFTIWGWIEIARVKPDALP